MRTGLLSVLTGRRERRPSPVADRASHRIAVLYIAGSECTGLLGTTRARTRTGTIGILYRDVGLFFVTGGGLELDGFLSIVRRRDLVLSGLEYVWEECLVCCVRSVRSLHAAAVASP